MGTPDELADEVKLEVVVNLIIERPEVLIVLSDQK